MAIDTQTGTSDRNERLLAWALEHGEFRGQQAADHLGVKVQGIGPVLSSMVRNGDLLVRVHGSTRLYVAAAEEEPEQDIIDIHGFESTLKTELTTELGKLTEEAAQIDARRAQITQDISRIEAGLKELS
jgi:predicted transcriptional regulator